MRMKLSVAVLGLAMACPLFAGCSVDASVGSTPSVSKDALQKDISERLSKAGAAPKSVTCQEDLVGEVGKSTTCEVEFEASNSIDPVVKVTNVDGTTVNYDMTPTVSQKQLEKSVAATLEQGSSPKPDSVTCESGLAGTTDSFAYCTVDSEGNSVRRLVTVTKVDGLSMDYSVVPILIKPAVETALLNQLEQQLGQRPESAECSGDLQGKVGDSIDCVVTNGSETQTLALTVTGTEGDQINFSFQPKE